MKRALLVLVGILSLLFAQAQQTEEDYVGGGDTSRTSKSDAEKWRARDNLFYGGGLGLGYSNGWIVNVNPQIGVQYKKVLGAGVGFDYQYYGSTVSSFQSIGPSIFARGKAFEALLLQAEYVQLYFKESYLGETYSYSAPMFLVGGGYQDGGDNGGLFLMVLWDLIQDPNNPLPTPIIRAGVSIGF